MKRMKKLMGRVFGRRHELVLSNIAEGTHEDSITKLADAAIATRYLLVKHGSDANHIAVCGANEKPLGVCDDEPSAAEREVSVGLLGLSPRTRLMVASEAIALDSDLFTAASGKVQDEPAGAGTYYNVGRAITAATADGDVIEVVPREPLEFVVA
jgi:hypothetical protein